MRDLYQSHELELSDKLAIGQLERLCREQIEDTRVLSRTKEILASAFKSKDKTLLLDQYGVKGEDDISLKELVTLLGKGPTTSTSIYQKIGDSGDCPASTIYKPSKCSSLQELIPIGSGL